ncbi:MAG: hypothetical protein II770_01375 [Bacteroidales bacterium]|nr:hypothetical protein [Bacteroidales bacterium]
MNQTSNGKMTWSRTSSTPSTTLFPSESDGILNLVAMYSFSDGSLVTLAIVLFFAEKTHRNPLFLSTSQLGAPNILAYPFSSHFETSSTMVCTSSELNDLPLRFMLSTKQDHSRSLPTLPFEIYSIGKDPLGAFSTPNSTLLT